MNNIREKCYSFTVITPITPWKTFWLRIAAVVAQWAETIATKVGPEGRGWMARLWVVRDLVELSRLSFIHKARFVILPRRSFACSKRGQPKKHLRYNYLLFLSNFTTSWDPYIDDIATVAPAILDGIWGWTVGYNRFKPFDEFKAYIRRIQFDTDYYFAAYHEASTTDVRAALHLTRALHEFQGQVAVGPVDFQDLYPSLLESIQGDLAATTPPAAPQGVVGPRPLLRPRKRGLVAICPLRHDSDGAIPVREQLRAFFADQSETNGGPLAAVGGIHFARFVVIEEVSREGREQPRDQPLNTYLLYACDFDGHLHDHVARLFQCVPKFVQGVWGHCRGLDPGFNQAAFLECIRRHRFRSIFRIDDAPRMCVGEIQHALTVQREFIDFLVKTQGLPMPAIEQQFSAFAREMKI